MSQNSVSSPKHCAKQGRLVNINNKLYKKLLFTFSTLLTSVASLILIVWMTLHPSKPEFSVKEVGVYQLKLSDPDLLNSSIELSLLSENPNQKVGIYYQDLQLFATYKDQQITVSASLPSFYQGHQDSNLLSASLIGNGLPVSPMFKYEVGRDQTAGTLTLSLKVNGKVRWKVGTWVSGTYRIFVSCTAVLEFCPGNPAGPWNSKQGSHCSTSV